MKIDTYQPTYQQGIVDLVLPIQQREFGIDITLAEQPDLTDIPGFFQKNKGQFWVAYDEKAEKVIGTVGLLDIGYRKGVIRKMFVVAQELLETLVSWSLDHGFSDIYLGTTAKYHAAHRFYEKNGFVEIPAWKLPDEFPLVRVDTKFYRRILPLTRDPYADCV